MKVRLQTNPMLVHFILPAVLVMGVPAVWAGNPTTTAPNPDLETLVQQYFKEKDASRRAEIGVAIQSHEGVDVERVVEALARVKVWEPRPAGPADFAYASAAGVRKTVRMVVPEGYSPDRSYPLAIGLYEGPEAEAQTFMESFTADASPVLVALPRGFAGGCFAGSAAEALEPEDLLREIRLRYHVDVDRVYVIGAGEKNGAAAINLALFHAHWIAGVIALEPAPDAPYPRQAYPFLLQNLSNTPLFIARVSRPASQAQSRPADERVLPDPLEVIQAVALREKLPISVTQIQDFRQAADGAWRNAIRELLHTRRQADARVVSHWFRYPVQGRVGWLRQETFDGEPWEDSLITVLSAPSTDFHTYATKVLQSKLAYIGGRIEGRRITISAERTDRLELRLHQGLLDLSQPIEIDWAGHTRTTVKVTPRISTVLETAYEDWDFQHPASVRLIAHRDGTLRQR